MKIDLDYCFVDDVVEGFTFQPEFFINAQSGNDRKMGDKLQSCYRRLETSEDFPTKGGR